MKFFISLWKEQNKTNSACVVKIKPNHFLLFPYYSWGRIHTDSIKTCLQSLWELKKICTQISQTKGNTLRGKRNKVRDERPWFSSGSFTASSSEFKYGSLLRPQFPYQNMRPFPALTFSELAGKKYSYYLWQLIIQKEDQLLPAVQQTPERRYQIPGVRQSGLLVLMFQLCAAQRHHI